MKRQIGITAKGVRRIIKQKHITQALVAERAGFTPQQLNDMLQGRKLIYADYIPALAAAIDTEPGEIFREETETARPEGADSIRLNIDLGNCGYRYECRTKNDVLNHIRDAMEDLVRTVSVTIVQDTAAEQAAETPRT